MERLAGLAEQLGVPPPTAGPAGPDPGPGGQPTSRRGWGDDFLHVRPPPVDEGPLDAVNAVVNAVAGRYTAPHLGPPAALAHTAHTPVPLPATQQTLHSTGQTSNGTGQRRREGGSEARRRGSCLHPSSARSRTSSANSDSASMSGDEDWEGGGRGTGAWWTSFRARALGAQGLVSPSSLHHHDDDQADQGDMSTLKTKSSAKGLDDHI